MKLNQYAYKGDGSFHRMWINAEVIKETKNYIITKTPQKTKVIESDGYSWRSKEKAINYFSKSRWFNVIVMYKDGNCPESVVYYCNLASPFVKENNAIKYIDYDLDIKYNVKTQKMKLLDVNEYKYNSEKYGYSKQVIDKVNKELEELKYWIKKEVGPFSKEFREEWSEK